jgi:recombination associated protein RdgC
MSGISSLLANWSFENLMWFKNLQLYRLPAPWKMTAESLGEALATRRFAPCGALEAVSSGFAPPLPAVAPDEWVRNIGGQWLLCLETETRLLPTQVIRQETRARAEKIAVEQGFPPGRRAMKDLQDQVRDELLPRAFTSRRQMMVWVDPQAGWLGMDAPGTPRAEAALEALRDALPDLPLRLVATAISPAAAMTEWLASGEAPAGFSIDRECELKAANEERPSVRYVRHPLQDETLPEIRAHLAAGKLPTRLALTFDDRVSLVLTEKGEIRRLTFLDVLKESLDGMDNTCEIFDAEFALMTGELSRLIPALLDNLGGEKSAAA